jgi:hypothetical protein
VTLLANDIPAESCHLVGILVIFDGVLHIQLALQATSYIVGAGLPPVLDPWVERGWVGAVVGASLLYFSFSPAKSMCLVQYVFR